MRLLRRRGEGASTLDLLVAGLGNPGREYERTRHNAGWLVVDEVARRHGGSWRSKFSGSLSEVRLGERRLALLKPETYMNESGRSVSAAARFFKVPADSILVVHDDVDLEAGRLQARRGGGLAGHNGLRSLEQELGTQDFLRLRIGVGRPGRGDPRPVADWVLAPFAPEEDVEALVARAAAARSMRSAAPACASRTPGSRRGNDRVWALSPRARRARGLSGAADEAGSEGGAQLLAARSDLVWRRRPPPVDRARPAAALAFPRPVPRDPLRRRVDRLRPKQAGLRLLPGPARAALPRLVRRRRAQSPGRRDAAGIHSHRRPRHLAAPRKDAPPARRRRALCAHGGACRRAADCSRRNHGRLPH